MKNTTRLREFVQAFTRLIDTHGNDEAFMMDKGSEFLRSLIVNDDWLVTLAMPRSSQTMS